MIYFSKQRMPVKYKEKSISFFSYIKITLCFLLGKQTMAAAHDRPSKTSSHQPVFTFELHRVKLH